ncbi:MAG: hypothetical protein NTW50_00665 [Candidatus Berkelbacteria bacterium]|nr:hypothetical protein [Candidatus Berkelbacteria bacterium]
MLSVDGLSGGGGANNGPGTVTLECSSTKKDNINYLLSTMWHEISHLLLEDYIEATAEILDEDSTVAEISEEAAKNDFDYTGELVSFSLFSPVSCLTQRYFATEIGTQLAQAIKDQNYKWLLNAHYVLPMYLIYQNGKSIEDCVLTGNSLSPAEFAARIIENHQKTKDFFSSHQKYPVWFSYES